VGLERLFSSGSPRSEVDQSFAFVALFSAVRSLGTLLQEPRLRSLQFLSLTGEPYAKNI
jgi:hypothetical protein